MIDIAQDNDLYAADFARFRESPGGRALELTRRAAFDRFRALGFPTTRHEAWRFTNAAPIARTAFALAEPAGAQLKPATSPRLVFVNGHYDGGLSSLDGWRSPPLPE